MSVLKCEWSLPKWLHLTVFGGKMRPASPPPPSASRSSYLRTVLILRKLREAPALCHFHKDTIHTVSRHRVFDKERNRHTGRDCEATQRLLWRGMSELPQDKTESRYCTSAHSHTEAGLQLLAS